MDSAKHIGFSLLRLIIVLLIAAVIFYIGIVVGYTVIGNGKASDILNSESWRNFFTLFK